MGYFQGPNLRYPVILTKRLNAVWVTDDNELSGASSFRVLDAVQICPSDITDLVRLKDLSQKTEVRGQLSYVRVDAATNDIEHKVVETPCHDPQYPAKTEGQKRRCSEAGATPAPLTSPKP